MSASEHSVTEFAFLNLVLPTTLETPKLVLGFLDAAVAQPSWSGYPLHLFYSTKESSDAPATTIYIISGWASVPAHYEWIASPKNQELLKFFGDEGLMTVGGVAHLDIDFEKLSFEECAAIVWRKLEVNRDSGDSIASDVGESKGESGLSPELMPKTNARVLWSHRGRAVDEGVKDEYELTAYTEGELGEFGEGFTVIRKWIPQTEQ